MSIPEFTLDMIGENNFKGPRGCRRMLWAVAGLVTVQPSGFAVTESTHFKVCMSNQSMDEIRLCACYFSARMV